MFKRPTVATHDRWFHPDDVTAVAIISLFEKKMPKIIRTRDELKLIKADYVVDVGGQYDPSRKLFDHHQKEFTVAYGNGIPLASAGLVWKEYGAVICGSVDVANEVTWKLIMPIDCEDSGKQLAESKYPGVNQYTLFDILGHFTPRDAGRKVLDKRFVMAVNFMREILLKEIDKAKYTIASQEKLDALYAYTSNPKLLILEEHLSWRKWALQQPELLFVISTNKEDGKWHIHTVSEPGTFKSRKLLPESWGGKSKSELAALTGVPDVVFCHKDRFIAGAMSKDGILKLAQLALEA